MAKVTKKDLIETVARKAHITKSGAREVIDVFLEEVGRSLGKGVGSKVVISGFGTLKVIRMEGKTVKIPNTEKMVTVKAHLYPSFTPGKKLKRQVKR